MPDASLDLLVFGPHPDDIEIGMAGTIARHAAEGFRVGLCDLTRGEMASNGTVEERLAEAEEAADVLGVTLRFNLGLPDGWLRPDEETQVRAVAEAIRRFRPRTVAAPYWRDRHPDHVTASRLVTHAAFKSGLRRYTAATGEPWRPDWICYYFVNDDQPTTFVVDVTGYYDRKREALACHRSQFAPAGSTAAATRLTSPLFLQLVESRDARFGAQAGVGFAEGFVVREPLLRPHLLKSWTAQHAAGDAATDRTTAGARSSLIPSDMGTA
jgi:bacillithiol biosynthesis deacetylase BshB1